MLDLVEKNRALIERRSRERFLAHSAATPSEQELSQGIPMLIDQLLETLRSGQNQMPDSEIESSATRYGGNLFGLGFTVAELVQAYGALCETVMDLGQELDAHFSPHEFETLNRILDVAIAAAVTEHQRRLSEELTDRGAEDLGALAHELRNSLAAAAMAFSIIKRGGVGVRGRTADVVDRSLVRMESLIDHALTEVRLHADAVPVFERLRLVEMIDQIAVVLQRDAESHRQTLRVEVDHELQIETDRQLLTTAISNLMQNALKYSHADGQVTVRARSRDGHLIVEVEDECGGLAPGLADDIFAPFVRGSSRSPGVGLGLAIVMRSAKKLGGDVSVRDLPGKGCVFTLAVPAARPEQGLATPVGPSSPAMS